MVNKNVLMVVHSYYLDDTRVRREAEALVESGFEVDVICLKKTNEVVQEVFNGVRIFRCNVRRSDTRSKFSYIVEYLSFFIRALGKSTKLSFANKYDVFFAHNMPNFLVFIGICAKLRGAKLVLDMHDSMPELYSNLFGIKKGVLMSLLRLEEKLSVLFANKCMTANRPITKILSKRNGVEFHVTHNTPDLSVLNCVKQSETNKTFKLFHHGNIHQRYGLDRVLKPLKELNESGLSCELEVHGRGPWYESVKLKAAELEVQKACKFFGGFKPEQIGSYIKNADVGLVLNHKDSLTDLLLPVKMLEYASCKIPIICSRTQAIEEYFTSADVYFFEDEKELAQLIKHIINNPEEAKEKAERAYQTYLAIEWSKEKQDFVEFVKAL